MGVAKKKAVVKQTKKKTVKKAVSKSLKKTEKGTGKKKTAKKTDKSPVSKASVAKREPATETKKTVVKKSVKKTVKKFTEQAGAVKKDKKTVGASAKTTGNVTAADTKKLSSQWKRLVATKEAETVQSDFPKEYEEISLKKYDSGAHSSHTGYFYDPLRTEEPPHSYFIDRAVILPIDPKFAFIYWETREDTLHHLHERYGFDAKLVVRVYDVTNIDFNGYNAHEWWDIEVYHRIGSWYIKHSRGDRNLIIDIGLRAGDGTFHVIARSRSISFPREHMVAPGKILWMLVDEFGNKVVSEVEDYTDEDLKLLRAILGEERFKRLREGGLDIFLGGSAWGRLPVVEHYIDLSKLMSSGSVGASKPSSRS
ncbi:MAG: DUF4912 domain-containing protein [Oligoflexia bacterium]|nr:DUF4912 domain-containing protein [Oligoflexia bacterium]